MENNEYRYDSESGILDLPADVGDSVLLGNLIEQHMLDCVWVDTSFSFPMDEKKALLKVASDKAVLPAIKDFLRERPVGDYDRLENLIRSRCHQAANRMEAIEADAFAEARAFYRRQVETEDFRHAG